MAQKIRPKSQAPRPGQSSEEYWRERETRQRAENIKNEASIAERINKIFRTTQDNIEQEIDSFYQRYAAKEGIDIIEARRRVSQIDMEKYERLAEQYVKAAHEGGRDVAFSDEANEQMRLYNATMRINRLEMLKARCGIRAMEGYRLTEQLINDSMEERAYSEYYRLAGILGNTVQFNENLVRSIVDASYQNATWSQRLWNNQAVLSAQIGAQLAQGILTGKSSTVLARNIQKLTGAGTYECQRLMRTELRRVQTTAAERSMLDNGVDEYKYLVANGVNPCEECLALDGMVFKISEMTVGRNAPPKHPFCHCCTCPHVDEDKWQRWIQSGMQEPWGEFEDVEGENKRSTLYATSAEMMDKILQQIDEQFDHNPITIDQINSIYTGDILGVINSSQDSYNKAIKTNFGKIFIVNENCSGLACLTNKGIRFNIWKDKNNNTGEWSILFHEIGHRIDHLYGEISDTDTFRNALKNDFESVVNSVMIKKSLTQKESYKFISKRLRASPNSRSVSDIFGGLSDNKCVGEYGHFDPGFWDDPKNLSYEAFANFFSAYVRNSKDELKYIQTAFPTATRIFESTMRRVVK